MVDLIKDYVENRIQLVKFEIISVVANVSSRLISSVLSLLMVVGVLLMFSIALALWIGQYYENTALGFTIMGGVFLLIFIIYIAFAKKSIDAKVKDKVVQAALEAEGDLVND